MICVQCLLSCLFPIVMGIVTTTLPLCMGRRECYFSYDYFYDGGFSLLKGISCKYDNMAIFIPCCIFQIIRALIWSNIVDICLIITIGITLKSQANSTSTKNLLTPNALKERKRLVKINNVK